MSNGLFGALVFGNAGAGIPTSDWCDNSDEVYPVDSANTVTNEARLNGLLDSNVGTRSK